MMIDFGFRMMYTDSTLKSKRKTEESQSSFLATAIAEASPSGDFL
jgi:hypothetical protein